MVSSVLAAIGVVATLVPATLAPVTPASGREAANIPFAQRDGRAEALADIAAHRPVRLYMHRADGVIPVTIVPGLADCPPRDAARPGARVQFVHLPAADWAEGHTYSAEQDREIGAAHQFARDYNATMLRKRRPAVLSVCPKVRSSGTGYPVPNTSALVKATAGQRPAPPARNPP